VGAYAAVLRLLSQPPCPASDLTAAWQRLVATKHPGCASLKPKVEDTLKRSNAWDAFQAVELADSETCDRALVKAWNEALFADWGPAETRRPRVELARERLALVDKLSERADAALSLEGEKALVQIALEIKTAHGAYAYELKPRARQAQERLRAVQELREGLRRPASDRKIHRAWRSLVALEGQSLAPEAWRPLVEKAEKRAPLLARLEAVPPGYVPAEAPQFDAVVLEVFEQNEALLEGCHDAEACRGDYRQARQRRELLAELGAAMARPDHARIVRLVGEPCLDGYPFPDEWQKTIQQAREEHLACLSLVEALEGDDRARFHAVFDAAIIGRNRSAFEAHRAKLREWVPAEILPLCKIGLGPPVGDPPLAPVEEAAHPVFRACWRWPDLRMNDSCVLAVCRQRPQADANPYLLPSVLFTRQVDRRAYEDGFGAVQLGFREEWDGAYVGVWAVVDLGFESFFSECLVLGQLGKLREPGEARWGVTTLFDSLWS